MLNVKIYTEQVLFLLKKWVNIILSDITVKNEQDTDTMSD